MYRVLLERGAEKDLSRLSSEIHDRVVTAIQALATNPPGAASWPAASTTGESALVTNAFFMKLLTRFESSGLIGCGIAVRFIVERLARSKNERK